MTTHIEACTCPDPRCARHPATVGFSDAVQAAMDLVLTGNAYLVDGKRVPPEDVLVVDCGTAEPVGAVHPLYALDQADLAEALAELLDNALHLEGCYVGPEDTHCVCLIGKLRELLPLCSWQGGRGWKCYRTAHPSTPNQHTYGQV